MMSLESKLWQNVAIWSVLWVGKSRCYYFMRFVRFKWVDWTAVYEYIKLIQLMELGTTCRRCCILIQTITSCIVGTLNFLVLIFVKFGWLVNKSEKTFLFPIHAFTFCSYYRVLTHIFIFLSSCSRFFHHCSPSIDGDVLFFSALILSYSPFKIF
mgnify:CR=1 FL=1